MEASMIHAEMVLVVPVLVFTFLVMGWIMVQFRGYLRRRDGLMADMEARHAPAETAVHDGFHREAA
jgi:hypothetical protein